MLYKTFIEKLYVIYYNENTLKKIVSNIKREFVFQVNLYEILKPHNSLMVFLTWQQFNLDRDDVVVDNIKLQYINELGFSETVM